MGRKHGHAKKVFQDSPFLEIPGELRMMIYEAALVKPTAIDLWPHKYVETPENDPSLVARITKTQADPQPRHRQRGPWVPKFRKQDDLLYVRKEMATGLLATCKQICQEATSVFWCKNTFRFAADGDWLGVRRFLATIGPSAIRRLRTLEVFVPLGHYPATVDVQGPVEGWREICQAKNVPKLHMAKVGSSSKIDAEVERNMEIVTSLLREAMSTLELRLIVPCGFTLNQNGWATGVQPEIVIPEELQARRPFTKVTLIVESGAYVYGAEIPEKIAGHGLDVVLMPGSFLKEAVDTTDEEAKVTELKRWGNAFDEFEILNGLQDLMKENDNRFGVPGRGGRVNKCPGTKKVERVLKGFGESKNSLCDSIRDLCSNMMLMAIPTPLAAVLTRHSSGGCRFISRLGFDCSGCQTTRFEPNLSHPNPFLVWANCEGCGRFLHHDSREGVVVVKKRARYLRLAENT